MGEIVTKVEECKAVPWKDWNEWIIVYDLVMSPRMTQSFLLIESIQAWHTRGKLPLSIEATLGFLTIMSQDDGINVNGKSIANKDALNLMYGQAITRFVNLLTDSVQDGGIACSMEKLAGSLNIPAWIIQCRHAITHGHSSPSLDVLRAAANYLLNEYIVPRYWRAQRLLLPNGSLTYSHPIYTSGVNLVETYFRDITLSVSLQSHDLLELLDGATIHWLVKYPQENLEDSPIKMEILLRTIAQTDEFQTLLEQMIYYGNIPLLRLVLGMQETAAFTRTMLITKSVSDECGISLQQVSELLGMPIRV